ncbi:putative nwd2 protein [Mycena sanguinolenta]|uniref:Putative nwd2 protein n=1 Tax=Mycena sanguinolenta TaxID=230812 RepID=A0A8H7D706_9AGAR|nr:putative nwd2 protein [Mycena sanguinolenta]
MSRQFSEFRSINIYGGTGGGGGQGGRQGGHGGDGYGATLHLDGTIIREFNNIGHDFIQKIYYTAAAGAQIIWQEIAGVKASYNSDSQFSRGDCLPGTRESLLSDINKWITSDRGSPPVCWVSGPAGVGKSAVALTVAKACAKDNGLAASFFFCRSDPRRNNPSFLMLSIAHGLLTLMPPLRPLIEQRISHDPSVMEALLEDQFRELIVGPLQQGKLDGHLMPWVDRKHPCLIIIDGLDECSDPTTQRRIISTFISPYQQYPDFPLRLLICSRSESWIQDAFDLPEARSFIHHITLSDLYLPDEDIEKYFVHAFQSIRANPKYSQVKFPATWPSEDDLKRLVMNASGQFSYATTVTQFVKTGDSYPIDQLRSILENSSNVNDPFRQSFFAQIDQVYCQIISSGLSNISDGTKLLSIFSAILLLPNHGPTSPEFIELLLGLPCGSVAIALETMHSVFEVRGRGDAIRVHQNSFASYLSDESRSREFHINNTEYRNKLALQWLRVLAKQCKPPVQRFNPSEAIVFANWAEFCSTVEQPSKELLQELGSLDLLNLLNAVARNPTIQSTSFWSAQKSRRHWPLIFRSFKIVTSWLQREGISTDHRFADVQRSFRAQFSPDEIAQRDLESWVALNHTECMWECSFTKHVDDSVADLLKGVQGGSLSTPPTTPVSSMDIDIYATCFQIVDRLGCDLHVLAERTRTSRPLISETSEMEGIISNLLDSKLLEQCGPQPELFSTFHTISEDVKMLLEKMHIQPSYNLAGRRNNLMSWCDSLPQEYADHKVFLRNDILSLLEKDEHLSSFLDRRSLFLFVILCFLFLCLDWYFALGIILKPEPMCNVRIDSVITRILPLRACDTGTFTSAR